MIFDEEILSAKVLIIDDQKVNARLLEEILRKSGYKNITCIYDARDAQTVYAALKPHAVVLDLNMPYLDGFQVITQLKEIEGDDYLPVLMLTQTGDNDLRFLAMESGAKDYLNKPYDRVEVLLRLRNIIEVHLLHDRLRNQNKELEEKVRQRTQDLRDARLDMVHRLARVAEYRDKATGVHIVRMSYYSAALAEKIGFSKDDCELVLVASSLHDIGKVAIPDSILLKSEGLTDEEREVMKRHTAIGASILSGSNTKVMQMACEIALTHHEKWNGKGYPQGLKGEKIPVLGRICALCDVFDALISDRPYKKAWPLESAVEEIRKESGASFDPGLIDNFLAILPEIRQIKEKYDTLRSENNA